eukprot:COSAG01_NODE_445_length_16991_cov_24.504262_4_plen_100_part_00
MSNQACRYEQDAPGKAQQLCCCAVLWQRAILLFCVFPLLLGPEFPAGPDSLLFQRGRAAGGPSRESGPAGNSGPSREKTQNFENRSLAAALLQVRTIDS